MARIAMGEAEIAYLEEVAEQSMERRKTILGGSVPTSKARAAEMVLATWAPRLLAEIRSLQH